MNFLEILESRIAPAVVIAPNGLSATYDDVDGDKVTIKISSGDLNLATISTAAVGLGEQLQSLDFTGGGLNPGASITFSVKKVPTGNGLANVGEINADGFDVGAVTIKGDLGQINAGDANDATPGLKLLKVDSMGLFETATGASSIASLIKGEFTSLQVKGDVSKVLIQTTGAGIGSITIGGSLIGGDAGLEGCFLIDGNVGTVKIGGDIVGGMGVSAGTLIVAGNLSSISLGGSLLGGGVMNAGRIDVNGDLGTVKIKGDVIGGAGEDTGRIEAASILGSVSIGGSLLGDAGLRSGSIQTTGSIGSVKLTGGVSGGAGEESGSIYAGMRMGAVSLGGSLVGGAGSYSGIVSSENQLGAVKIGGDVRGGSATTVSGAIGISVAGSANSLESVSIKGSLIGGSGALSGVIFTTGNIDKGVKIGLNITGGSITGTDSLNGSGYIEAGQSISSVSVGGSIVAGRDDSTGALTRNASIHAGGALGAVTVKGSLTGSSNADGNGLVVISAGFAAQPAQLVLKSLTVGKNVQFANILGGYDVDTMPVNGNAQLGAVKVKGDWVASNLVAGIMNAASSNASFGNANDAVIPGGQPDILARLASVVIGGQVIGKAGGTEHFGFSAQLIGPFKTAGLQPSATGPYFFPLSWATGDVNIHSLGQ